MSIDHWYFTETALKNVQTPTEFRQLLLKEIDHFRMLHQVVCRYAVDRGEEFAHVLFSLQRFTTVLRVPSIMNNYYAYLQRGWVSCANLICTWPSFQAAFPTLATLRDFLGPRCLASPAFRDEIRQSRYTNMLRVYGAECRLANSAPKYIQRTFKEGVATSLRNYYQSLLVFWCVHVRAKLRHWRLAHSFRPLPLFVSKTDTLDVLVYRNPRRVPLATEEWSRAIQTQGSISDGTLQTPNLQQWLTQCPELLPPFGELCIRSEKDHYLLRILKQYLNDPTFPFTQESLLACIKLYRKICWTPRLFRQFLESYHIQTHLHDPLVTEYITRLYVDREMCLRLATTFGKDPISTQLWHSAAMQQKYQAILAEAEQVRERFIMGACREWRRRCELRKVALTTYRHCWLTVANRWRWVRDHRMCPVCMEIGHRLIALHGEKRHAICRECLWRVQGSGNRCPMCRHHLEICTVSCASSVSYTSDYEDPNYDDDQWYHYD
jgi:hypothetical protein